MMGAGGRGLGARGLWLGCGFDQACRVFRYQAIIFVVQGMTSYTMVCKPIKKLGIAIYHDYSSF